MSVAIKIFGHVRIVGSEDPQTDFTVGVPGVASDASTSDELGNFDITIAGDLNTSYSLAFFKAGFVPAVETAKPLNQDDTAIRCNAVMAPISGYIAPIVSPVDQTFVFDVSTETDVSMWIGAYIGDSTDAVAQALYDNTSGALSFSSNDVWSILDTSVSFSDFILTMMDEFGGFPEKPIIT